MPTGGDTSGDDFVGLADEQEVSTNLYLNPDGSYSEEVRAVVVDEFNDAVHDGRAFSVSTGTQAITSANYLKFIFKNPANSGKTAFVYLRQFFNDSKVDIPELHFYVNPTPLVSPTTVVPNNMNTGAGTSVMEFTRKMENTSFGTPQISFPLPINGIEKNTTVVRMVKAGESFGYEFAGAGGGVNNALRASSTFFWYEEPEISE